MEQLSVARAAEVFLELNDMDEAEEHRIELFAAQGCSCTFGHGGSPCCKQFSVTHYREMRTWCQEMTRDERDKVIKGLIMALTCVNNDKAYDRISPCFKLAAEGVYYLPPSRSNSVQNYIPLPSCHRSLRPQGYQEKLPRERSGG